MRSWRQFCRSIAIMVIALAVIASAVRAASATIPLHLSALLANPDGSACALPCVLGIRPGATTLRQAANILTRHPLVRYMDNLHCAAEWGWCYFQLRNFDISGLVRSDPSGRVISVYLLFTSEQPLTLGDFIGALGVPSSMIPRYRCCATENFIYRVKRTLPRFGFWFFFPQAGFLVRDIAQFEGTAYRLQPKSPVFDFTVGEPNQIPNNMTFPARTDYWDRWYGFTSVERYFAIARMNGWPE